MLPFTTSLFILHTSAYPYPFLALLNVYTFVGGRSGYNIIAGDQFARCFVAEGTDEIYDGMVAFCERCGRAKAFEEFISALFLTP